MTPNLHGIRVLLADDHAMVRLGFRLLLEGAGAKVVGEAGSGEDAIRLFAEFQPDVLVMDVSMPGIGGLAALDRLIAGTPQARVLILSAHHDESVPMRAIRQGARGYLCKRALPEEFLQAVSQLAADRRYLDPQLAQAVALARVSGMENPVDALTEKEFAVFMQLAQGRSVNDVARDFSVSASTIGTHLYHIKQKLNLQNAAEIALLAMRSGLVEA